MSDRRVYYRRIPYNNDQFFLQYKSLAEQESHHVFLESGRGGRYSIAGLSPFAVVCSDQEGIQIQMDGETKAQAGIPLSEFESWMKAFEVPKLEGLPDFQGGAVGYISYDYARYIERLPNLAEDDLGLPLLYFLVFQEWAVFDQQTETLWLLAISENDKEGERLLDEAEEKWTASLMKKESAAIAPADDQLIVSFSEEAFKEAVERTKQYIAQGDVFQVNLSVRQSKKLGVPAIAVYEELRKLNPSPYMAYIHTPEFQIVSGSPELLIKKADKELSTRPIAGTRSRGKDDAEDLQLASELIENEKERAEHVMLVDLERNDLGRVSAYGSVEVDEFMVIEKYSHVQHIVSNVRGLLAEGKMNADVVEAVFPGGTITGAPKVRTMEIIEELEPVRREIYTGSIGWLGFNGDLELNIVIRTMLVENGMCHVQAGAGVVIDSDPKSEYKESLKKAEAVWKAKELAEKRRAAIKTGGEPQ
ncbi:aminodeoxychorismate synthase component I [Bacillus aerolatus]|uniref:Aminodeoxychorismate synthase component I n=1 Tax=Bacillus aerolatus TaxID=2653354 RepID=A0A6I1FD02_9BACI|nr:anthranilate synthase component I family protein [Bacillus aerolatus]KAB7705360.1 aminodeoxychorismate synthase component I [Bacillus aerolatus]